MFIGHTFSMTPQRDKDMAMIEQMTERMSACVQIARVVLSICAACIMMWTLKTIENIALEVLMCVWNLDVQCGQLAVHIVTIGQNT